MKIATEKEKTIARLYPDLTELDNVRNELLLMETNCKVDHKISINDTLTTVLSNGSFVGTNVLTVLTTVTYIRIYGMDFALSENFNIFLKVNQR